MEQTVKSGDFVRLTDPIDNGTIVRIEEVNENGFAEWLQELAAFKDETPITEEWLNEKFWFDTECEYWDFDTDVNPVEIREIRKNHFYSIFVPHFNYKINVRTRGQLRCFISACGFGDCVKQLKS